MVFNQYLNKGLGFLGASNNTHDLKKCFIRNNGTTILFLKSQKNLIYL